MKLKRLLAATLAGVMAMTSSVVTSVTANAETTETTLGTFFTGEAVLSGSSWNSQWIQLSHNDQAWTWADILANENAYLKATYSMDDTGVANHNNAFTNGGLEQGWYSGDIKAYTSTSIPMYYDGNNVEAGTDYVAYLPFSELLLTEDNVDQWGQIGFNMQANMEGEWTLKSVLLVEIKEVVEDEPVEDEEVLETGTYSDGKWSELSAEELAAAGTLNTIATAKDEYVTTTNTLSVQYNANEQKLRIYKLYNEADLTGKSSGSIVVKKGNVGLKLTAECVYSKLADGQTAPEGCYYIAWVISGVDDPTEFSYSDITLA